MNKIIHGASCAHVHANRTYTREELDKTIHGLETEVDIMEIIPEILKEQEVPKINWNV
jgi:hypothetical protein